MFVIIEKKLLENIEPLEIFTKHNILVLILSKILDK